MSICGNAGVLRLPRGKRREPDLILDAADFRDVFRSARVNSLKQCDGRRRRDEHLVDSGGLRAGPAKGGNQEAGGVCSCVSRSNDCEVVEVGVEDGDREVAARTEGVDSTTGPCLSSLT